MAAIDMSGGSAPSRALHQVRYQSGLTVRIIFGFTGRCRANHPRFISSHHPINALYLRKRILAKLQRHRSIRMTLTAISFHCNIQHNRIRNDRSNLADRLIEYKVSTCDQERVSCWLYFLLCVNVCEFWLVLFRVS